MRRVNRTQDTPISQQKSGQRVRSKSKNSETKKKLLERLDETLARLYELYHDIANAEIEIYEGWNAKEILGHITFWHESFAHNVSDLVKGNEPSPLKGKYAELNRQSIDEMRTLTTEQIKRRLQTAHRVIQQNILSEKVGMIPYRKGSRSYTPEEHLEIVNGHIVEHLMSIEKARTSK